MKKLMIVLLLAAGLSARLFAIGLGAEWGLRTYDDALVTGPALLIYSGNGLNLAVDWNIKRDYTDMGATLDKMFRLFKIANIGSGQLNFNLGAGGFINFSLPHKKKAALTNVIGGLRFPIGVSFDFGGVFSVYIDAAPAVSLEFVPSFEFGSYQGSAVRAGFVFWL